MRWYHVSHTLTAQSLELFPRAGRCDEETAQDREAFIAVCPSVQQCLVAIGDWYDLGIVNVYEAFPSQTPMPATWVFDYHLTQEHRLYKATRFVKVRQLDTLVLAKQISRLKVCGNLIETVLANLQQNLNELREVGV